MPATPRPWIKLYTTALTSDRVLDLSPPAAKLWMMSLLRGAQECRDGLVVAAPARRVARWSGLDAGLVPDAIDELVAAELWQIEGDDARLARWEELQTTEHKVSAERAATRERVARHRARKASAKRGDPMPASQPTQITAKALAATVAEACDETDGTVRQYLEVLGIAREVAVANPVSEKISSHLDNVVIAHAYKRHHDAEVEPRKLTRLYKAAAQLGDAGAAHVLWSIVSTATADIEGDAISYVIAAAKRHATEVAA